MSTRGQRAASKKDTASKFAELRALKSSGKKRIDLYKAVEEDDIYEEVDEDGYKQVVRNRLDQNDFVVDDNGLGYADNGMDDWQERHGDYDSDENVEKGQTSGKGKRENTKKREGKVQEDKINKYLSKTPLSLPPVRTVRACKYSGVHG